MHPRLATSIGQALPIDGTLWYPSPHPLSGRALFFSTFASFSSPQPQS